MKKKVFCAVYNKKDVTYLPGKAVDFMAFWNEKLSMIPPEFRASAQIMVKAATSYDQPCLEVVVGYSRLETDDEEKLRVTRERRLDDAIEKRERSEFDRLRKKYES